MQCALIVTAAGLAMLLVERLAPGRRLERVAGWYSRAILLNVVQAAAAYLTTLTWDRWFPRLALFHARGFGLVPDALLGYVVLTFVYCWWHRARHENECLWRYLHQVHHSASRLEVIASFYKHPLEILANGVLSPAILYLLLGLDAPSASLAFLLTGLAELAQNGYETYSARFFIDWAGGSLELTPQVYRALHGPYNRRNAYGAAISYAPVLMKNPRTRPLVDSVARHGFCGDAPLKAELDIPRDATPIRIRLEPRGAASAADAWQREFTIRCDSP